MLILLLNKPEYFLLGSVSVIIIFYCLIVLSSIRITRATTRSVYYNGLLALLFCVLLTCFCLIVAYYFLFSVNLSLPLLESLSLRLRIIVLLFFSLYLVVLLLNHKDYKHLPIEFVVHGFFVLMASLIMVSTNNILSIFLALEAQAIGVIFVIAFETNSRQSTEAAWRYFLMNGVASAFLLLGIAFITLGNGSFSIDNSPLHVYNMYPLTTLKAASAGAWIFVIGLSIKLGLAPLHWWMPSVYEGLSGNSLMLLGVVSKVAQLGVLVKFFVTFGSSIGLGWFFTIVGLFSVIVGGLGIIENVSLKRQIAFLSVYSSGIVYLFLAYLTSHSIAFAVYYIVISNLFLFMYIYLISVIKDEFSLKTVWDLKNFKDAFPGSAYLLVTFLIGILGLPPLIGFLPKYLFLFSFGLHSQYLYLFIFLLATALVVFAIVNLFKEIFFELSVPKRLWLTRIKFRHFGWWNSVFLACAIVFLIFFVVGVLSFLL